MKTQKTTLDILSAAADTIDVARFKLVCKAFGVTPIHTQRRLVCKIEPQVTGRDPRDASGSNLEEDTATRRGLRRLKSKRTAPDEGGVASKEEGQEVGEHMCCPVSSWFYTFSQKRTSAQLGLCVSKLEGVHNLPSHTCSAKQEKENPIAGGNIW